MTSNPSSGYTNYIDNGVIFKMHGWLNITSGDLQVVGTTTIRSDGDVGMLNDRA
jgi:hypothetical protein